ncbi:MAG: hypothetical protein HKP20_02760, partial [Akkermansiaceae bacterium]|nr:hypothetical protein [Akkermansiaceae bacterium]
MCLINPTQELSTYPIMTENNSPQASSSARFAGLPFDLPSDAAAVLNAAPSVAVANSVDELIELATRDAGADGW